MEWGTVVELVGDIGAVGVLAWLVHHVFTRLLPRQTQQHAESLQEQAATFREALGELAAERRAETGRMVDAVGELESSVEGLAGQVERNSRLLMMHDATMRRAAGVDVTTEELATSAGLHPDAIASVVREVTERFAVKLEAGDSGEIAREVARQLGRLG